MNRSVSTTILKQVPEEQQEEVSQLFCDSERVLELVRAAIREKIESARKQQMSRSSYESPAWSEYQADSIGYQRALHEVDKLLEIRTQTDHA